MNRARFFAVPPALRVEIFLGRGSISSAGQTYPWRLGSRATLLLSTHRRGLGTVYDLGRPKGKTLYPLRIEYQRAASTTATSTSTSTTTTPPSPESASSPQTSRLTRYLTRTALFLAIFTAAFAMSAAPAADTLNGFANPPTDLETLSLFHPSTPTAEEINDHITNHPLAVSLRRKENVVESRPHLKIPAAMRPHNFTGGTLAGSGMLEVPPLNFSERGELPTLVQLAYLGPDLCGHPGLIHGGLLATLLDEGLARACFPALPNKVGVTASLKIDYRVPCPAGSYVVLKAQTTKVEGRKAWCQGWIEILGEDGEGEGTKIVEAEALFIEPRQAKGMARLYSST